MVGIPGTSKGCNTCRRRKVGCDQQKPHCNRCVRTGRLCEGYERPASYHRRSRTASTDERSSRSTSISRKQSHPRPPLPTPPSSRQGSSNSSSDLGIPRHSHARTSISTPATPPDDHPVVPLARFSPIVPPTDFPQKSQITDQKLLNAFLDVYFPKDLVARHDSNHIWLQQAAFLPKPNEALRLALRAVSLSRVGWCHNDDSLVVEGRATYTAALAAFQQALWTPELANRDETLAAGRVVTIYELFEATSFKNGWNSHQKGLAALFQMRGPDSLTSPLGRSLLESFRGPAMFHAIQFRTTSFLTYPEWRQNLDESTDGQQHLYDIGLRLAAVLHEQDSRRTSSVSSGDPFGIDAGSFPHLDMDVLRSDLNMFSGFDAELQSFYARLAKDCSNGGMPLYWDTSASTHTAFSDQKQLRGINGKHSPLHFPNLSIAQTLMNYWALQSLVSSTISGLCQAIKQAEAEAAAFVFFDPTFTTEPETTLADPMLGMQPALSAAPIPDPLVEELASQHSLERCHHLSTQIVRGVPYCTTDQMGLVGPQRCMFPVRVAVVSLKQGGSSDDLMWAQSTLSELSAKKGLLYANQLQSLGGRWEEVESSLDDDRCGSC